MALSEPEIRDGLGRLLGRKLISQRDQASARVPKFEHLVRLRHSLPPAEQAVLAVLMLRGPQTAGEIRQRTERMHTFADIEAVDAVLEHLQEKFPPMATALPRAPGTKETRFAHLMGGRQMLAAQIELRRPRSNCSATRRSRLAMPVDAVPNSRRRCAACVMNSISCVRISTGFAPSSNDADSAASGWRNGCRIARFPCRIARFPPEPHRLKTRFQC